MFLRARNPTKLQKGPSVPTHQRSFPVPVPVISRSLGLRLSTPLDLRRFYSDNVIIDDFGNEILLPGPPGGATQVKPTPPPTKSTASTASTPTSTPNSDSNKKATTPSNTATSAAPKTPTPETSATPTPTPPPPAAAPTSPSTTTESSATAKKPKRTTTATGEKKKSTKTPSTPTSIPTSTPPTPPAPSRPATSTASTATPRTAGTGPSPSPSPRPRAPSTFSYTPKSPSTRPNDPRANTQPGKQTKQRVFTALSPIQLREKTEQPQEPGPTEILEVPNEFKDAIENYFITNNRDEFLDWWKTTFPRPTKESYQYLLYALMRKFQTEKVVSFFEEMKNTPGCEPDGITYVLLFDTIANASQYSAEVIGKYVQEMLSKNIAPTVLHLNPLLRAYAKAGDRDSVKRIYNQFTSPPYSVRPNTITISTLVRTFSTKEHISEMEHWLRVLEEKGFPYTKSIYRSMIIGYSSTGNFKAIENVLSEIRRTRAPLDPGLLNLLLQTYTQFGTFSQLIDVLQEYARAHFLPHPSAVPALSLRVSQRTNRDDQEKYQRLFELIKEGKPVTFLISHIEGASASSYAPEDYWQEFRKYQQTGNIESLAQWFKERTHHLSSSAMAEQFNHFVSALINRDLISKIIPIFDLLKGRGFYPKAETYNLLFRSLLKFNHCNEAHRLWEEMKQRGVKPTVTTFVSLVEGETSPQRIQAYIAEMRAQGLEPHLTMYNSLLGAYADQRQTAEMVETFKHIKSPNYRTYGTMIRGFSTTGKTEEMMHWFQQMKAAGFKINEKVAMALLAGYRNAGDFAGAQKCYEMILQERVPLNTFIFQELLRIYSQHGTWEQLIDLLKKFQGTDYQVSGRVIGNRVNSRKELDPRFAELAQKLSQRGSSTVPEVLTLISQGEQETPKQQE